MEQYLALGEDILANGNTRGDRTGTGTVSVFGRQERFDLSKGFPLLTSKQMWTKAIIHELLWFLQGDTNNNTLVGKGVTIWDEWAVQNRRVLTLDERLDYYHAQCKRENKVSAFKAFAGCEMDNEQEHEVLDKEGVPRYELFEGDGELGPIYGKQWRTWDSIRFISEADYDFQKIEAINDDGFYVKESFDQIAELIHNLKTKPFSRRHVISAWNVADLPDESVSPQQNVKNGKMALPPCHCLFQFYVRERTLKERFEEAELRLPDYNRRGYKYGDDLNEDIQDYVDDLGIMKYKLDCQLYQRSADFILGVPFNIASYALLTMMIAQCVDMVPGEFIHTFGDLHIYKNHIQKFTEEQLPRKDKLYDLPIMSINPAAKNIFDFKFEDFKLLNYMSHAKVVYDISV